MSSFMRGETPLTSRLLKPVLIIAIRRDPTVRFGRSVWILSCSRHCVRHDRRTSFKILWALLDVMTIVILGSGVYLWLVRRPKKKR